MFDQENIWKELEMLWARCEGVRGVRLSSFASPNSVDLGSNPGLAYGLRFVDLYLTLRAFLRVLRFSSLIKIDNNGPAVIGEICSSVPFSSGIKLNKIEIKYSELCICSM